MSLVKPDDYWTLWALMVSGTSAAIWLEQSFKWAAKLSGPVVALLIAMLLSNTRMMPVESPAYDFINAWLVPLAIPLLLFRANAFQIVRGTGRMFLCFHVSAIGTLLGTILAVTLLRSQIPNPGLAHAAGIMTASYIGGGVNFFAVAGSYNVAAGISSPLIVADNFVMAAIFVTLLFIAASKHFRARFRLSQTSGDAAAVDNQAALYWKRKDIALLDIAMALAVGFVAVAIANIAGIAARAAFGDVSASGSTIQMLHTLCTNKFVLITTSSLIIATLFHKPLSRINGPEEIGTYLLYLFLFSIGLPADLKSVLLQAPLFFVFCGIIALVNLAFSLGAAKLLRLPLEETLLGVNATLGGAPSAAAMAISAGWPRLVLPALLAGIWGYVIGTPIGIFVVEFLR